MSVIWVKECVLFTPIPADTLRLAGSTREITLLFVAWFDDRHFALLAVLVYGLSMIYSVFLWRKGFRRDDRVNYLLLFAGCCLHTTAMIKRGFSLNHCPVTNLYEATLFAAWTIVVLYLAVGLWSARLRFLGA